MKNVIEALNLISGHKEEQIISGMRLSSLILDVYKGGDEIAVAALVYPFNYEDHILVKFGDKVPIYTKDLKTLNLYLNYSEKEYIEKLNEMDEECLLIVICNWLYKIELGVINMRIGEKVWELGTKIIPIFKARLGHTNVEFYINQMDIHLQTMAQMGWVGP